MKQVEKTPTMATLTPDPHSRYMPASSLAPASTAVWIMLAVISMFFFLFTVAYRIRMALPDWQPLNEPWQLSISTAMLVMSCITMHLCYRKSALLPSLTASRALLRLTLFFTLAFITTQLWAWDHLYDLNKGIGSNPANSFFYLLTGLHGLHVIGGLVALGWVVFHTMRGNPNTLHPALRLCSRYWHFLLFVWLFLLGLLRFT
ncbi:cytochrome c oxidase subunit 3 [Photobacterium minamisatsumaniensis]|uniref:cytochrome c oxidase subunit 3 n=1 Tax=Photobacterium minamisatsumaniensis TaxID=2910233 RepID=UPI003D0D7559